MVAFLGCQTLRQSASIVYDRKIGLFSDKFTQFMDLTRLRQVLRAVNFEDPVQGEPVLRARGYYGPCLDRLERVVAETNCFVFGDHSVLVIDDDKIIFRGVEFTEKLGMGLQFARRSSPHPVVHMRGVTTGWGGVGGQQAREVLSSIC